MSDNEFVDGSFKITKGTLATAFNPKVLGAGALFPCYIQA